MLTDDIDSLAQKDSPEFQPKKKKKKKQQTVYHITVAVQAITPKTTCISTAFASSMPDEASAERVARRTSAYATVQKRQRE